MNRIVLDVLNKKCGRKGQKENCSQILFNPDSPLKCMLALGKCGHMNTGDRTSLYFLYRAVLK